MRHPTLADYYNSTKTVLLRHISEVKFHSTGKISGQFMFGQTSHAQVR